MQASTPRPLQIEFEVPLYHVPSQGNNRQDIFTDTEDPKSFLLISLLIAQTELMNLTSSHMY